MGKLSDKAKAKQVAELIKKIRTRKTRESD